MPRPETLDQNKASIRSLISRAQELRHSDTLAEKLAWKLLRNRHTCSTISFAGKFPWAIHYGFLLFVRFLLVVALKLVSGVTQGRCRNELSSQARIGKKRLSGAPVNGMDWKAVSGVRRFPKIQEWWRPVMEQVGY